MHSSLFFASLGSDYDCYSVNGDTEADGQPEFDKSSTIPRHSNIAQNYRRMIQTKRPASTAGLPSAMGAQGGTGGGGSGTPGCATIRRTPSTKPGVRRTLSNAGPIPIRPPIVPVKTPTVPDSPGGYPGPPARVGSEECVFYAADDASPAALEYVKASPKRLSLPNAAWGTAGAEMSVYGQPGEEDQLLAANRHSLVEKIGELVASAQALGDGQYPFPLLAPEGQTNPQSKCPQQEGEDMLVSIRRGVRLRKTVSNDRSAPRILWQLMEREMKVPFKKALCVDSVGNHLWKEEDSKKFNSMLKEIVIVSNDHKKKNRSKILNNNRLRPL